MAIDPKLLVVKPVSELPTVANPTTGEILYYDGTGDLKKTSVQYFLQMVSGIAKPISTTDPTPSTVGWYKPELAGTYANAGGLTAVDGFDTLFYFDGTNWIKTEIKLPNTKIPEFSALSFPVGQGTQTVYNDEIWAVKEGQTAASTDIPTYDISSKWEPIGLSKNSTFKDFINPVLEVGAIALNNGATTGSTTRGRTTSFLDIKYAYQLELIGDMRIQNIFYYTATNVFISTQVVNGKTFTPTIPGTAAKFKTSLYHVTNTQTVTQAELDALTVNFYSSESITFDDLLENSKNSEKVSTDYSAFEINLADGVYKELGGIDITNGSDTPNNIRIRTARIKLTNGSYNLTQDAGYVISRVVNYKDGIFVNYGTLPDFTIDELISNEVRFVWSKTVATDIITQAEVDAFKFNLEKLNANKFEQLDDKINQSQSSDASWFSNKKMSSMGDSITYGFIPRNYPGYPGQLDSYAKQAANLLGMTWDNRGISGSTVGQLGSDTTTNAPMINRINVMASDAKVVTFNGGVNDLRKIHVLGVMSDRVPSTFYGALHILIQGLLNKYVYSQNLTLSKDILIVGITPIKTYPDTPISGLTVKDYANAMKEVCAYYAVPCFDANNLSGLTPEEFRTLQGTEPGYTDLYNPLITDGTHPTKEGNALFARAFSGFLQTLVS